MLGRKVEQMVLREVLQHARDAGIERLLGRYIPTAKNALVKDHYPALGFELISESRGTTVWSLATSAHVAEAPMRVVRPDAASLAA